MARSLFLANGCPLRLITVGQFGAMYSLSRQSTYNLLNDGKLQIGLSPGLSVLARLDFCLGRLTYYYYLYYPLGTLCAIFRPCSKSN